MSNNCIVKILKNVKYEHERNQNKDPQDILIIALKEILIKCKIPGITYRNLKEASYNTKKYNEAILLLKEKKILTEIEFGRTNVLFLTEFIKNKVEQTELNILDK